MFEKIFKVIDIVLIMKKERKRILFVCKFNRFRSRVAEAYFNKINRNKLFFAEGAGLFEGYLPLTKVQVEVAKNLGIDINGKPRAVDRGLLKQTNILIIVADDVPKSIYEDDRIYKNKIEVWKIPDQISNKEEDTKRIIKAIMLKVEDLVGRLE